MDTINGQLPAVSDARQGSAGKVAVVPEQGLLPQHKGGENHGLEEDNLQTEDKEVTQLNGLNEIHQAAHCLHIDITVTPAQQKQHDEHQTNPVGCKVAVSRPDYTIPVGWNHVEVQQVKVDPNYSPTCQSDRQLGHLRDPSPTGKEKDIDTLKNCREINVPATKPVKAAEVANNEDTGWTEDRNLPNGWSADILTVTNADFPPHLSKNMFGITVHDHAHEYHDGFHELHQKPLGPHHLVAGHEGREEELIHHHHHNVDGDTEKSFATQLTISSGPSIVSKVGGEKSQVICVYTTDTSPSHPFNLHFWIKVVPKVWECRPLHQAAVLRDRCTGKAHYLDNAFLGAAELSQDKGVASAEDAGRIVTCAVGEADDDLDSIETEDTGRRSGKKTVKTNLEVNASNLNTLPALSVNTVRMSWSIAGLEELDDKQGVDRVEIHGVEEAIKVFNTTYPDLDLSLFSSCQEDILLPPILRDFLHDLEQGLGDLPTHVEETDKILKVDGGSSQELFQRKQALLWSGSDHQAPGGVHRSLQHQEQQHVAEESCLGSSTSHPVLGRAERLNKTAHEDLGDTLVDSSVSEAPKASEVHRDVDDDHDLVHQVQVKQDSAKSVSVGPRHVSHHEAEAPEGPREGPHWVGGVRACDVSQAGWLLGHQSVQDGAEVVIEFVRNEKNEMEFGVTELEQEEERAGQAHRQVHMVPHQLTGDHGQLQVFIVLLTTITNQELQRLRYNLQVKMSEMIVNTDTAYLYTGDGKHLVKDDILKSVHIAIPFQYNGWPGGHDEELTVLLVVHEQVDVWSKKQGLQLEGTVHVQVPEQDDVGQGDGVCHNQAEAPHSHVPVVTREGVHEVWHQEGQVYLQVQILTEFNYKDTAYLYAGQVLAYVHEHHRSKLEDRKLLDQEEGLGSEAISADQTFPEGWIWINDSNLPVGWQTQSGTEMARHQPLQHSIVRAQISSRNSCCTIHLDRVIIDHTTEVFELSMELVKQDNISQREEPLVNVEMKRKSCSGLHLHQINTCNECARAMSCTISLHGSIAVTNLFPSSACREVNLMSSSMNDNINRNTGSQSVDMIRLCDTVHTSLHLPPVTAVGQHEHDFLHQSDGGVHEESVDLCGGHSHVSHQSVDPRRVPHQSDEQAAVHDELVAAQCPHYGRHHEAGVRKVPLEVPRQAGGVGGGDDLQAGQLPVQQNVRVRVVTGKMSSSVPCHVQHRVGADQGVPRDGHYQPLYQGVQDGGHEHLCESRAVGTVPHHPAKGGGLVHGDVHAIYLVHSVQNQYQVGISSFQVYFEHGDWDLITNNADKGLMKFMAQEIMAVLTVRGDADSYSVVMGPFSLGILSIADPRIKPPSINRSCLLEGGEIYTCKLM